MKKALTVLNLGIRAIEVCDDLLKKIKDGSVEPPADLHRAVAAIVFEVDEDAVTPSQRQFVKHATFASRYSLTLATVKNPHVE